MFLYMFYLLLIDELPTMFFTMWINNITVPT